MRREEGVGLTEEGTCHRVGVGGERPLQQLQEMVTETVWVVLPTMVKQVLPV